ncbi:hypothetical protein KFE98_10095 [bacterium SCSIO 12741]|nr:hypothetical protein KFE98_10095 [bacterium SCSIO 12741]
MKTLVSLTLFNLLLSWSCLAQNGFHNTYHVETLQSATGSYIVSYANHVRVPDVEKNKLAIVPIGFGFEYNNKTYTHLVVSPKGWASFDTTITSIAAGNDLDSSGLKNVIAPLWDDHDTVHYGHGYASYLHGTQVFTFEWLDWVYTPGIGVIQVVMQLELHQHSNRIRFNYDQGHQGAQPIGMQASIGLRNDQVGPGSFISIGSHQSFKSGNLIETTEKDTLSLVPGVDYLFTPCKNLVPDTIWDTVNCQAHQALDGKYYYTPGTYTIHLPRKSLCDSSYTLMLAAGSSAIFRDTVVDVGCQNYLSTNQQVWYNSGIYQELVPSIDSTNCDTLRRYDITVKDYQETRYDTVCDSYTAPDGKTYTSSQYFLAHKTNLNDCDSILGIYLTVKRKSQTTFWDTLCAPRMSSTGKLFTTTGIYFDTLTNAVGCDSLERYELVISDSSLTKMKDTVCHSYTWKEAHGQVLFQTGVYLDTLPNQFGCDSILELNLMVKPESRLSFWDTLCGSFQSPTGKIWTKSGIHTDTLTNVYGCDSLLHFNLIIHQPSVVNHRFSSCYEYISPSGKVWTQSGQYQDTLLNAAGCDSLLYFDLTIYPVTIEQFSFTACDSFVSPTGKVWTQSGLHHDTLFNHFGCDSLRREYQLLIGHNSYASLVDTVCQAYQTPAGSRWTVSGIYQEKLNTPLGCDSIIEYRLTIYPLSDSVTMNGNRLTADQDSARYQWIDCENGLPLTGDTLRSFQAQTNGEYALVVSKNGCTDTSACLKVEGLGFQEESANTQIRLYPNPVKDQLHIELEWEQFERISLTWLDGLGREVSQKDLQVHPGSNSFDINVENLEGGWYTLWIQGNGQSKAFLIEKQ